MSSRKYDYLIIVCFSVVTNTTCFKLLTIEQKIYFFLKRKILFQLNTTLLRLSGFAHKNIILYFQRWTF